ncbi:hypothetical protein DFH01_09645 [Falsiroseomonas bella]|uniref:Uncharacterized protein n=1 Tax=Falsiroseomonas bella TaxID=2184016 RepID=A0A317FDF9_9PROT|nr:hypothetical protein DFH01_09645 [Falsiroseomonas bella]
MASASSGVSHSFRRLPWRMLSNTGRRHQPRIAPCRSTVRTGETTSRSRVVSAAPGRSRSSHASSSSSWFTSSQRMACRFVRFRKSRKRLSLRLVSSDLSRFR